jgi:hypothetical protein
MSLKLFKKELRESLFLDETEKELFDQLPDNIWKSIFKNNFDNDLDLTRKVIWNELDKINYNDLDDEIKAINNFDKSIDIIDSYLKANKPIFFVCDIDNDGSSAQASLLEFKKLYPNNNIVSEYWQVINGNDTRGFSYDYVKYLTESLGFKKTDDFLIVTADNGINSSVEAVKIEKEFKKAKLLITDHHMPSESVVQETDKVTIFNPQYKPTKFFENRNISGAHTLTVLLKEIIQRNYPLEQTAIKNMDEIAKVSNQLDYVNTDIRHKPLKNYMISKFAGLGNLMNVNNSSNQIITGHWDTSVIDNLKKEVPELDGDKVKYSLRKIKAQNLFAYNLLHIITDFNNQSLEEEDELVYAAKIYDLLLERMENVKPDFESEINPNFVEQLRPYLINFESKGDKTAFEQAISEAMEQVFMVIKKEEGLIQKELRKAPIMNVLKNENSTILTPKNTDILSIFNRKFLTKTFNEENNGFFMVLNKLKPEMYSGSMRSIYSIEDLLKISPKFEKKHGVKLSYQGHKVAAGFFVEKDTKDVTYKTIEALNEYMSKEVEKLKRKEAKQNNEYVVANFDAMVLIDKINAKLKANLPNATAIEPLLKISKTTYVTDTETTKQVHIGKLVEKQKYGYKPVSLSFDGKAVILPVEMIKHVVNNGYKDYIQLGYMDEGAFIAKAIKSEQSINPDLITTIKQNEQSRRDLEAYYKEHYKKENGYRVEVTEDMIKGLPYFKNNSYGEIEYQRFKNMVISILDYSRADMLAVTDTEGTGLGQAPKLFNLGAMNLMIDEEGSEKISLSKYKKNTLVDFKGMTVFVEDDLKPQFKAVSKAQYDKYGFNRKMRVFKEANGSLIEVPEKLMGKLKKIHNMKKEGNKVIINRNIKSDMLSVMINDSDIKLTQEIIALTGIDNELLRRVGINSKEADKVWVDYYKDKNVIFQAHNLPYDSGILKTNLPEVSKMLGESMLSDSALYSKGMKLAYDKVTIGKFPKILELKKLEFYDSPYSEISLSKFLENDDMEKMPDRTGNYVLKKDGSKIRLIDKRKDTEIELPVELDDLRDAKVRDHMNSQSIKYSVEMLSLHEAIRNLLLSQVDLDKDIKMVNIPTELSSKPELMEFFMKQYHFDEPLYANIDNFQHALVMLDNEEDQRFLNSMDNMDALKKMGAEFLEENKKVVAKFQDVWVYKKVLSKYEPEQKEISEDILNVLSYETDLPESKIKEVLLDAYEYKKKFGLDHIVVHECHNNVVYDREGYGDVILEGVLTVKRLIDTTYNSYTHHISDPANAFVTNILNTTEKALNSDLGDVAMDAYSRKQSKTYTRRKKTDKIKEMVNPQRTKFKLGKEILPPQTYIEVDKVKKRLSQKNVADLREMVNFIAINRIASMSVVTDRSKKNHISMGSADVIANMKEKNRHQVEKYTKEIGKLLGDDVYFERRTAVMKKITSNIVKIYEQGECKFDMGKDLKDVCLNDIDFMEIDTFASKFGNVLGKMEMLNPDAETMIEDYVAAIEDYTEEMKVHRKEYLDATKDPSGNNIIRSIDTTKRDLPKWLFKTGSIYMEKLAFEIVEQNTIKNKRKKAPIKKRKPTKKP